MTINSMLQIALSVSVIFNSISIISLCQSLKQNNKLIAKLSIMESFVKDFIIDDNYIDKN